MKSLVENASEKKIKYLRSDNGGEYISTEFMNIFYKIGVKIQHFVPYTPQQNGVAERKNRSLKEMTTLMLEEKGLAANLWAEAMNFATHIQNILPHSSVKGNTPFESYFGHKSDMSNFGVFGSTAWPEFRMTRGRLCNRKVLNVCSLDIYKNIWIQVVKYKNQTNFH